MKITAIIALFCVLSISCGEKEPPDTRIHSYGAKKIVDVINFTQTHAGEMDGYAMYVSEDGYSITVLTADSYFKRNYPVARIGEKYHGDWTKESK